MIRNGVNIDHKAVMCTFIFCPTVVLVPPR